MSRSFLLKLGAALLLVACIGCGGGASAPAKGPMDAEPGEGSGEEGTSRSRAKQAARSIDLSQIPVLSFDGIPLPESVARPGEEVAATGAGCAGILVGKVQGPPLLLWAMSPHATAAPPPPRNLFAFEEDPAPIAERKRQADEAARKAQEAAEQARLIRERWQGPPLPPPPPPPPQPPSIPFQFIGYMGPAEDRIGVFSGPTLFLAKKGDLVQNQFVILTIGYESAEIGFKNFNQTQRLPLSAGGK